MRPVSLDGDTEGEPELPWWREERKEVLYILTACE
jgi:hypothetical protein